MLTDTTAFITPQKNPHAIMTQEMNSPGITVWVGGIIEPFVFHGGNVNASSYLEMLQKEIVPTIEREMDLEEVVYMHDGAPAPLRPSCPPLSR